MLPLRIISTGKALPARQVSSGELDIRLHYKPGFVQKKSGIDVRYHANNTETQSGLAAAALRDAFRRGQITPASIDLLISASGVGEQALPCTACRILEPAGFPVGTAAFDINASCLGFLVALQVAANLLAGGSYRRIAVVASDLASRGIDWSDAETSLIFGDGAAAVIVERGNATVGMVAYRMEVYPEGKTYCEVRAGGSRCNPRAGDEPGDYLFRMDGKRIFRLASAVTGDFLKRLLRDSACALDDFDVVIPHQASHLGMAHLRQRLGIRPELMVDIYAQHGNQVAASIPTALHEAIEQKRFASGTRALLIGTGAGFAVGGMVLTQ